MLIYFLLFIIWFIVGGFCVAQTDGFEGVQVPIKIILFGVLGGPIMFFGWGILVFLCLVTSWFKKEPANLWSKW